MLPIKALVFALCCVPLTMCQQSAQEGNVAQAQPTPRAPTGLDLVGATRAYPDTHTVQTDDQQNQNPAGIARFLYGQFLQSNAVASPAEDLTLAVVDDALRAQLMLPEGQGLVVIALAPGGSAQTVGLVPNDILLAIDDKPLQQPDDLERHLKESGDKPVELRYFHMGHRRTIQVKPRYKVLLAPGGPEPANYFIGMQASGVDETLRAHLPALPNGQGLIATEIVAGSPAEKAGLTKNDLVFELAGKPLASAEDLVAAVQATSGKEANVKLLRAGKPIELKITPAKRTDQQANAAQQPLRLSLWLRAPDLANPSDQLYFYAPNGNPDWRAFNPASPHWTTWKPDQSDPVQPRLDQLDKQLKTLQQSMEDLRKAIDSGNKEKK